MSGIILELLLIGFKLVLECYWFSVLHNIKVVN